jgi:hypothetical protein
LCPTSILANKTFYAYSRLFLSNIPVINAIITIIRNTFQAIVVVPDIYSDNTFADALASQPETEAPYDVDATYNIKGERTESVKQPITMLSDAEKALQNAEYTAIVDEWVGSVDRERVFDDILATMTFCNSEYQVKTELNPHLFVSSFTHLLLLNY